MSVKSIKVIHVASRLNIGGLALQVLNLCGNLDGEEFECAVVTGQLSGDEGDMLGFMASPERLKIIPELGRKIHPLADLVALVKLCDHFRDVRPDIVHTHASKAGALGRIAAFIAHVPIVVHSYDGHVFRHYFGTCASRTIRLIEKTLGLVTNAVVLPCDSQVSEIVDEFRIVPARKARVVRYGIDVESFAANPHSMESARSHFNVGRKALVVAAIGRLAPIKNHRLLIDAFGLLPPAILGRSVELLIHGEGECLADIEKRIDELGLRDRVHFVSWVKDLRLVYAAIDVLAITSKAEGMPISAMEAMASGVPVVSTAVGGMPDMLKNGMGFLVQRPQPAEFAVSLFKALDYNFDTGRPREFVRRNHGIEVLVDDTRKLYRELMEKKACPRQPS